METYPEDILAAILDCLADTDLLTVLFVCQRWKKVLKERMAERRVTSGMECAVRDGTCLLSRRFVVQNHRPSPSVTVRLKR